MSTEGTSLEQMIDDQAVAAPEAVTPLPAPAPEAKGEKVAAPPAADRTPPAEEPPTVPRRALEDERRKRQEYEQRLDQLQRYIQEQQRPPQPKQPEPPAPDYYADPEGWQRYQMAQTQALIQREREQFQQELIRTRVDQSEELVRMQKPDFDEYKSIFVEAVQRSPQLLQEMVRAPNPAMYAYEIGRYLKVMSEVGTDPDGYVERKLAERQAAATGQPPPAQPPARSAAPVPKSLASTTSARPRDPRNGQFTERAPLEDLLG